MSKKNRNKKYDDYELVLSMREAVLDGYSFNEYHYNNGKKFPKFSVPSVEASMKAWRKAVELSEDNTAWQNWLSQKAKDSLIKLHKRIDNYFQEGFGIYQLDETFKISKGAILEMLNNVKG